MNNDAIVAVLPGDGIGPEVVAAACRVLQHVRPDIQLRYGAVGAVPLRTLGSALPPATFDLVKRSAGVLFGSVGGGEFTGAPSDMRPEYAILQLRREFDLFANMRPARMFDELIDTSPVRPEIVRGMDVVLVREATSGLYFSEPKRQEIDASGAESAVDTCRYTTHEIERVARFAFELAVSRRNILTSIDKENVLETSRLWRRVIDRLRHEYPSVRVEHLLADNALMQLMRRPRDFDVVVADNMFGDLISDELGMISGSIGNLPSASLNGATRFGLYEPIGGTAPDIAGFGIANPTAAILCGALLCRYSLDDEASARAIESAVAGAFAEGARTADIAAGRPALGTDAFTDRVIAQLEHTEKTEDRHVAV